MHRGTELGGNTCTVEQNQEGTHAPWNRNRREHMHRGVEPGETTCTVEQAHKGTHKMQCRELSLDKQLTTAMPVAGRMRGRGGSGNGAPPHGY